ncbi:MAG: ATP-binding protein [Chloroflexota bacterium]|nr:ATP-binding protein [Chloroflexota bacterium]
MATKANSSNAKSAIGSTVCPICHGAGFLRRDVPVDHPDFGRAIACECKLRETQQAELADLRGGSDIAHLTQMTFDSFRADGIGLNPDKRKNLRQAYEIAQQFARDSKGWLLLKGGYGSGKTHLAAGIANERLARGESVLFVVVPDLLDHLRATFAPTSRVTYDERFETVRATPFLILDDLGAQSATAWAQEKLFQLLNFRYNAQLPTVITMNRELEEIEPRIRSRLADATLCTIVTLLAPDFRQGGTDTRGAGVSNLAFYGEMTFDTFDLRENELKGDARSNLRRVVHIAKDYAEHPRGFIVFTGEYGCGKTHLAAAIANAIAQRGNSVSFVVVPDLLDHLRATFAPGSAVSYDQRFEETRSAPFLVLDDLGTESATPWAREKMFQIIDYRYVAKLPTIITIHREAQVEPRIQTRIFDLARGSVTEILAPSYRMTHRRAQMKPEAEERYPRGRGKYKRE